MMGKSNIEWFSFSDQGLLEAIGAFIRDNRLEQNKTQSELAEAAGINRSTLSQVENGSGGTLSTFIGLLRALKRLDILDPLAARKPVSPLQLAKMEQSGRQRAGRKNKSDNFIPSDW